MLELKPQMVNFVETGMNSLRSIGFAATLRNSFANDGCFAEMRSDARRNQALEIIASRKNGTVVEFQTLNMIASEIETEEDQLDALEIDFFRDLRRLHLNDNLSDSSNNASSTSDSDSE